MQVKEGDIVKSSWRTRPLSDMTTRIDTGLTTGWQYCSASPLDQSPSDDYRGRLDGSGNTMKLSLASCIGWNQIMNGRARGGGLKGRGGRGGGGRKSSADPKVNKSCL